MDRVGVDGRGDGNESWELGGLVEGRFMGRWQMGWVENSSWFAGWVFD